MDPDIKLIIIHSLPVFISPLLLSQIRPIILHLGSPITLSLSSFLSQWGKLSHEPYSVNLILFFKKNVFIPCWKTKGSKDVRTTTRASSEQPIYSRGALLDGTHHISEEVENRLWKAKILRNTDPIQAKCHVTISYWNVRWNERSHVAKVLIGLGWVQCLRMDRDILTILTVKGSVVI